MSAKKLFILALSVALIGLAGYAIWVLREPLTVGLTSVIAPRSKTADFTFVAVGDNHGVNPIYQQMIKDISKEPYAFLLNLADTSDDGTASEFAAVKTLESTLPFPTYHVIGSHDIKADPTRATFSKAFITQPCRSLDLGPVHLILLDNADRLVGFPAACLDWLQRDLAVKTTKAIIIAYHRPFGLPLSSVLGDDETSASRKTNERFLSIIKPYDIQYIFTAHLHTFLNYTLQGIPAVVSGGGGKDAQIVLGGPKANYFHYLIVHVKNGIVTTEVRRLELHDITTGG